MPSELVLHKYKRGTLRSGSKRGPRVKNRKQAIAILMSEKRKEDAGQGHGRKAKRGGKRR